MNADELLLMKNFEEQNLSLFIFCINLNKIYDKHNNINSYTDELYTLTYLCASNIALWTTFEFYNRFCKEHDLIYLIDKSKSEKELKDILETEKKYFIEGFPPGRKIRNIKLLCDCEVCKLVDYTMKLIYNMYGNIASF